MGLTEWISANSGLSAAIGLLAAALSALAGFAAGRRRQAKLADGAGGPAPREWIDATDAQAASDPTEKPKLQLGPAIDPNKLGNVYLSDLRAGVTAGLSYRGDFSVVSVLNFKGGVGKTTLCQNVAAHFAHLRGGSKRVLLLDFDYQGTLSEPLCASLGDKPSNAVWSIFDQKTSFEDILDHQIKQVKDPRLPGIFFLSADFRLQQEEERLFVKHALGNPFLDQRFMLRDFLESISEHGAANEEGEKFDVVIIDCPPRQTLLTINALAASTHVLAPTKADGFSTRAIGPLFENIAELRRKICPDLKALGIVGSMTERFETSREERAVLDDAARTAAGAWGEPVRVFERAIPNRTGIAERAGAGFAYLVGEAGNDTNSPHHIFAALGEEIAGELDK